MAEQSFPFENIDTTESQFSEWATNFQETGVQGSPTGTELGITVTGSDLNLTIAAGQAFIRGHYYINTDNLVLAVPSAGVNTRIDIVVVELDPEANTIVTKIVSGTAVASDPVAPTLTQSATGIYQLPIATLTIPTSTVALTAGMLVDTRTFMGNRVGIWTTATRPANPTAYQTLGYNTTSEIHEYWNGSTWGSFSPDLSGLIPKSTVTTSQDLIVADGASSVTRLGVGTDDQVLSVVAGAVAWANASGGPAGMTLLLDTSITTGVSEITYSGLGGYSTYQIMLTDVKVTGTFSALNIDQFNGTNAGEQIRWEMENNTSTENWLPNAGGNADIRGGQAADAYTPIYFAVNITNAGDNGIAAFSFVGGARQNNAYSQSHLGQGIITKGATALTSFRIASNANFYTGYIKIYGG
jgi:hypothetical protein